MVTHRVPHRPPWDEVCERFRRALWGLVVRLGVARMIVFILAALGVALFIDWRLALTSPLRLVILLVFLGGLVFGVHWELRRHLRRTWRDAEVLRYLDSLRPGGEDALLVLHELHHGEGVEEARSDLGQSLLGRAVQELDPTLRAARPGQAVNRARVKRWEMIAAGVLLAAVALTVLIPNYVGAGLARFFFPFTTVDWPHRTSIQVLGLPEDGTFRVAQGQPFTIEAQVGGVEVPAEVILYSRPKSGGTEISRPLSVQRAPAGQAGYRVTHTFPAVGESLLFYLAGGDAETDWLPLEIIPAPQLAQIVGIYRYPSYTGLGDRIISGGDIRGLEGTTVDLTYTSATDLKEVTFQLGEDTPKQQRLETARTFKIKFVLRESGSYQIRLLDTYGLRELRPEKYDIVVSPDGPPIAEILEPRYDLVATPQVSLRVGFRATDDFGLKKVDFLVAMGPSPPAPLSGNITGPIAQEGLLSTQTFNWDLSKMDLKPPVRLTYYLRAQDCRPTDTAAGSAGSASSAAATMPVGTTRSAAAAGEVAGGALPPGVTESRRYQIEVLKPSAFHLALFQEAKAFITEARLAYVNQRKAYDIGQKDWPAKGSGALEDEVWTDLLDAQRRSERAAERMKSLMTDFSRQIERNRMDYPLCTGRLNVIAKLLEQVVSRFHPSVARVLRETRPRTDAEAAPDALKATRTAALANCRDDQKLAALHLALMLRKLFDWRDLQNAFIQTTLLAERQTEVTDATAKIAPEFIGKEKEDLKDEDLTRLISLGTQQKAIYESEQALENELMSIVMTSEQIGRVFILVPISEAMGNLRKQRVQDNMKESWLKIQNNQPFMIVKMQKDCVTALEEVRTGLAVAGHLVEPDRPVAVADELVEKDLELAERKTVVTPEEGTGGEVPVNIDDLLRQARDRVKVPPTPTDELGLAIAREIDLQDAVRARTEYLDKNRSAAEMPRFLRLKVGMLGERQAAATEGGDQAVTFAEKAKESRVKNVLEIPRKEMGSVAGLLKASEVGGVSQAIQRDMIETLRDVLGMLARQRDIAAQTDEHVKSNHMDAFKRKYILQAKDLDVAARMAQDLDEAHVKQADVSRKALRLMSKLDTAPELVKRVEGESRQTAIGWQREVGRLLDGAKTYLGAFTPEAAPRVTEEQSLATVVSSVPADAVSVIQAGRIEKKLVDGLSASGELMRDAVVDLRRLMDLREEIKLAAVTRPADIVSVTTTKPMTREEYEALITPEALEKVVKESQLLSEALRAKMIESLKHGLDPKYRAALAAYIQAVAGREPKKEEGGTKEPPK